MLPTGKKSAIWGPSETRDPKNTKRALIIRIGFWGPQYNPKMRDWEASVGSRPQCLHSATRRWSWSGRARERNTITSKLSSTMTSYNIIFATAYSVLVNLDRSRVKVLVWGSGVGLLEAYAVNLQLETAP